MSTSTKKIPFVDLSREYQTFQADILKAVDRIGISGVYILGEELEAFEHAIAVYCGVKFALGVGNGTDALIFSLRALGIGHGDEVLTVPNTFIGTVGAIHAVGATTRFVDVTDDMNIDVTLIEETITPSTRAIVPVHLAGRPANIEAINNIAIKYKLSVVEDAAQAIGARLNGKSVGSLGDIGCFSLHPLKNLNVYGDGGFITTNREDLYEKIKQYRNHGLVNRDTCLSWGLNSRLDPLQAAIANLKLSHLEQLISRHRQIADLYGDSLSGLVNVPKEKKEEYCVYHNYIIQTPQRNQLQNYLEQNGIETKVHYPIPIHLQPAAKDLGYEKGNFPVTEYQVENMLSLPIFSELKHEEINRIILTIKKFFSLNT